MELFVHIDCPEEISEITPGVFIHLNFVVSNLSADGQWFTTIGQSLLHYAPPHITRMTHYIEGWSLGWSTPFADIPDNTTLTVRAREQPSGQLTKEQFRQIRL
jgi:hypothetical protein